MTVSANGKITFRAFQEFITASRSNTYFGCLSVDSCARVQTFVMPDMSVHTSIRRNIGLFHHWLIYQLYSHLNTNNNNLSIFCFSQGWLIFNLDIVRKHRIKTTLTLLFGSFFITLCLCILRYIMYIVHYPSQVN